MTEPLPSLESLRERIAALPARLRVVGDEEGDTAKPGDAPLAIIARQGRLILRLTAAIEGTEARLKTQEAERRTRADLEGAVAQAEEETRRVLRETALPLMDALDFAAQVARTREDSGLIDALAAARRDGVKRLAGVGISEIPATPGTAFDGRLHDAVESRPAPDGSVSRQYDILETIRPGYQRGTDVLRRASVITAE